MRALHFLPLLAVLLLPEAVSAQISACGTIPGLPCATGGASGLALIIANSIIPLLKIGFLAVGMLFFFYYGVRLMLESEDENTISETKSAYSYAIAGAVVVSLTGFFVNTISVGSPTVINPAPAINGLNIVIDYLMLMTSASVTSMMVFQGVRMILLQGQESEMEKLRQRFFHSLIGVAVILLAGRLVAAFLPGDGSSTVLSPEIIGIIKFLLQIFGALAVLGFIVAGIMLIVSTDEALKDRAKKAIFTTVISMIVVLAAYLIVQFVLAL